MSTGVIITGGVTVSSGATLDDTGASIVDSVHATGGASVTISGGTVNKNVLVSGTSGPVSVSNTTIGDDLNIGSNAGVVTVSDNAVSNDVNVTNNAPGGATVQDNSDVNCHQGNNHPYSGSGNNVAGDCNASNS